MLGLPFTKPLALISTKRHQSNFYVMKTSNAKTVTFIFSVVLTVLFSFKLDAQNANRVSAVEKQSVTTHVQAFLPLNITQDEKTVSISWEVQVDEGCKMTTYLVERSDDKGKTFYPIQFVHWRQSADAAAKTIVFLDTVPKMKKWYFYRVQSLPNGTGKQVSSGVLGTRTHRAIVQPAQITRVWNIYLDQFEVQWDFEFVDEDKIRGFQIYRGDATLEQCTKISGLVYRGMRYFTDKNPLSGLNSYQVVALDKLGVAVSSEVIIFDPDASESLISMH